MPSSRSVQTINSALGAYFAKRLEEIDKADDYRQTFTTGDNDGTTAFSITEYLNRAYRHSLQRQPRTKNKYVNGKYFHRSSRRNDVPEHGPASMSARNYGAAGIDCLRRILYLIRCGLLGTLMRLAQYTKTDRPRRVGFRQT